jgi:hypothetical protein
LDGITSFSTAPIRAVTSLGYALVVFCAGVLGWTVYVKLFTDSAVAGWTSLLAVVLLLGGMQFVALGIIGQYVARIFEESKQRPLYLVSETVDGGESSSSVGTAAKPTSLQSQ